MKLKNAMIMLLAVMVLVLAACGDKEKDNDKENDEAIENLNETGMPIVKEPITIEVFSGKAASTAKDWNDVPMLNEYEKMTNVKMNFTQVAIDGLAEKRNLALSGGSGLPELFYGAYIPNADIYKYGKQGIFIPLNDAIDKYAPNLKQYLEDYPEIKQAITFPDGNIYSVPTLHHPEALTSLMEDKPWINKEILDELGMENPETTEEFYQFLKASKELSVNGEEVIPFSSVSMGRLYHLISGAFGVANKGIMHSLIDEDPETKELRFYPIAEDYKAMLEYMHKLFDEGLIEQNIFTIQVDQFLANGIEGKYAAMNFFNPIDYFGEEIGGKYIPGNALEGPGGHKEYNALASPVRHLGQFLVTNENKNVEATLRWIDYFWSDEGARMFFMGLEGETYEMVDGEAQLLDVIANNPEGLTVQEALAKYIINPGGGHPVLNNPKYSTAPEFHQGDIDNAEKNKDYLIDDPWPAFLYEDDEQAELELIGGDLGKYVAEMQAGFVTGEISFSEWDSYVDQVKQMKLDEYMEIQQSALDRYLGN